MYLQIADVIIAEIYAGRLQAGDALPGSRTLARMFKVNRNTIVEALVVLVNEEWIVSKERIGTFVSYSLPRFSRSSTKVLEDVAENKDAPKKYRTNFDDGYPDTKIAPVVELARAYREIFNREARWHLMGYASEFGHPDFIRAIVQKLNHVRGMQVNRHMICITRGSQMAMYLVSQCLLDKGDLVAVEYPGYTDAWRVFENAGAALLHIPVDSDGLVVDELRNHLENGVQIKALYTTPHHQYPTTVTMTLKRRVELVRLSNVYGFTIIEDDYDNEFHYDSRPLLPLSSLAELRKYVYIGTMSKVVAPALRIGYLAANDNDLVKKIGALRKLIDVQGDGIMEQAVLQLINDGTIKRHLRKVSSYYRDKRDFVEDLIEEYLREKVTYATPSGGLAFWLVPSGVVNWEELSHKLETNSVKLFTPARYGIYNESGGIRIGFGALTRDELRFGIKVLANCLS